MRQKALELHWGGRASLREDVIRDEGFWVVGDEARIRVAASTSLILHSERYVRPSNG